MVLGILVGVLFPQESQHLKVVSNVFLRMIKCLLVPLVFSTLVVGIAAHSDDLKAVGRLALKSILYFEIVTTLALFIGLAAVNITKPGVGVKLPPPTDAPAMSREEPRTRRIYRIEARSPEAKFPLRELANGRRSGSGSGDAIRCRLRGNRLPPRRTFGIENRAAGIDPAAQNSMISRM